MRCFCICIIKFYVSNLCLLSVPFRQTRYVAELQFLSPRCLREREMLTDENPLNGEFNHN